MTDDYGPRSEQSNLAQDVVLPPSLLRYQAVDQVSLVVAGLSVGVAVVGFAMGLHTFDIIVGLVGILAIATVIVNRILYRRRIELFRRHLEGLGRRDQ